jgi:RES domain-containing protein
MVYEPDFLDFLEQNEVGPFEGLVFRHMLASYPPERPNYSGARWNPRDVPAVYTSRERATALAEAEYRLNFEPLPPKAERWMYHIAVDLVRVVRLSRADLRRLGLTDRLLKGLDFSACQKVGGAVDWPGCDGLIVPSARHKGDNLVIFTRNRAPDRRFEVVEREPIEP